MHTAFFGNQTERYSAIFQGKGIFGTPDKRGDYVHTGDRLALVSIDRQFSVLTSPAEGTVLSAKERSTDFAAYEPIINLFLQDSSRRNRELVAVTTFENLRASSK